MTENLYTGGLMAALAEQRREAAIRAAEDADREAVRNRKVAAAVRSLEDGAPFAAVDGDPLDLIIDRTDHDGRDSLWSAYAASLVGHEDTGWGIFASRDGSPIPVTAAKLRAWADHIDAHPL